MGQLSVEQVLAECRSGELRPVYLLVGPEQFLRRGMLAKLRQAVVGSEGVSLNEERFSATEVSPATVLAAARTLPMFGPRRLVVVTALERWEAGKDPTTPGVSQRPLDRLAQYVADPSDSTTLVLVADKLDSRRKLCVLAKKAGFYVPCEPLARNVLPRWVAQRAKLRRAEMTPRAADLLAELSGPDLSILDDAVERVTLFVGPGRAVDEEAVVTCVANLKSTSVWELVEAVGRRDPAEILSSLARVYERGAGPRLVGLLCWSARQLIRFGSARAAGADPRAAAQAAGVPPFKAQQLEAQLKLMPLPRAERWLIGLAEADRAMKGGSRLDPRAILEQVLLGVCR